VEPTLVFVYRLETTQYITISDLSSGSNLEAFEIEKDDFRTFTYTERNSAEGRGYFLQQDDMVKLAEEINRQIQRIRMGNPVGPVHIVTSESAAGSLRASLPRPKTVIGFPDSFSVGPLWKLDEKGGQVNRKEWIFEHINYESEDVEYETKFANTLREIEDIPNDVPIYIWFGNNPDEQTGLRFFLYLLREITNEIMLINSTAEEEQFFHTAQLDSNVMTRIFERNKRNNPLTENERNDFYQEWENLAQTKEVLRIWSGEEIKGVPEDIYDPLIIETIEILHSQQETKDFIKTAVVVGEIFTQMDTYIDYFFLEYRIRHLVYSGVLELKGIPKSMRHYSVKLK